MENENLLPFAVLAKADKKAKLLEEVAQKAKSIKEVKKRREILTQTNVLGGLRFSKQLLRQLLREDIRKESVTYQEIVEEDIEIGRRRALEEAKQREAGLILRQLKHRFWRIAPKSKAKIEQFSFTELENLGEALLDFISKEDLKVWLEKQK